MKRVPKIPSYCLNSFNTYSYFHVCIRLNCLALCYIAIKRSKTDSTAVLWLFFIWIGIHTEILQKSLIVLASKINIISKQRFYYSVLISVKSGIGIRIFFRRFLWNSHIIADGIGIAACPLKTKNLHANSYLYGCYHIY